MFDYQRIIDRHYPEGSPLRDIYLRHCRQVADKALSIARAKALTLPPGEIEAAAMLHDIGPRYMLPRLRALPAPRYARG